MTLTANDIPVVSGSIVMPRRGAWTANLELDSTDVLSEGALVTLVSLNGELTLVGTVVRPSGHYDEHMLYLVAGAGGLQKPLDPKGYNSIPATTVASEILADAGESLDPLSATALSGLLTHWSRNATTCDRALTVLADKLGAVWRVQPTGLVWVGTDEYVEAMGDHDADILDRDDAIGKIVLGCDTPWMLPGKSFDGLHVEHVTHELCSGTVRTYLQTSGEDRVRGAFARLTNKVLPDIDYSKPYRAKVVSQNGDGSLELLPLDAKLPPLSRVPIRYGIPGLSAKVAPGCTCLVAFDGGDPSRPTASLFDAGSLLEVEVTAALSAKITSLLIGLGDDAATGVATQLSMTPLLSLLIAQNAALILWLNDPSLVGTFAPSAATLTPLLASLAATSVTAALPTNFSLRVKAS
jgi:hypothetical protein